MFNGDLREFIQKSQELGEFKLIEGADWDLEIGGLTQLLSKIPNPPLLLFDKIKGHQPGYRVVSNMFASHRRTALGLGLSPDVKGMEMVRALRDRIKAGIPSVPPVTVKTGPVLENVLTGDQVDLTKFPSPKWHELDGGRYIGTGSIGIMRDPDEGWVNFGTYRIQVHDKTTATASMVPGHHANIIRQKYWDRGQSCPVAICCGQDPVLFVASTWERIPWGVSEFDFAGGLRGGPVQVVKGMTTDLPIPATAEIVLEGEIVPPEVESRNEGPFGEWPGYYAGGIKAMPAIRIKSVLHRNNPIIQGNPPSRRPAIWTLGRHIQKAASLWAELDRHVPGVQGVWMMEDASMHMMPVISIKQQYGGHAKQVALMTAGCGTTGWASRIIMVVDDDIDPSNVSEVIWALATRIDPETSIDIIKDCWTAPSDPMLSPEHKRLKQVTVSRALITACKPYWWIDQFPPSIETSEKLEEQLRKKWQHLFL